MSNAGLISPIDMTASATVEPGRFVIVSGAGTVAHAGANGDAIGISQESARRFDDASHADAGESVAIHSIVGSKAFLDLGGTVAAGGEIKSDASGQGVAAATTGTTIQKVRAKALEAGVDGDRIAVEIVHYDVRPALV